VIPNDGAPRSGVVVIDKPSGRTSHDVVAAVRKLARTRRVGHAGTLDPMATGVLVLGVGRATKLLTYLVGATKSYTATIRLGASTVTDDAEGEIIAAADASGVEDEDIEHAVARFRGEIAQVPSSVSAIKVDGRRSYARVRAGEQVALAARPVTVSRFDVLAVCRRDAGTAVDVDVVVDCSSGTYIRALARDVGAELGVGGHLVALRRTAVGPFGIGAARTLEQLAESFEVLSLAEVARAALPAWELSAVDAHRLAHGRRLPAAGSGRGPVAAFAPDGGLVAVVSERDGVARPLVVLASGTSPFRDEGKDA
jgi:tRNA pseudouridine55 synthase